MPIGAAAERWISGTPAPAPAAASPAPKPASSPAAAPPPPPPPPAASAAPKTAAPAPARDTRPPDAIDRSNDAKAAAAAAKPAATPVPASPWTLPPLIPAPAKPPVSSTSPTTTATPPATKPAAGPAPDNRSPDAIERSQQAQQAKPTTTPTPAAKPTATTTPAGTPAIVSPSTTPATPTATAKPTATPTPTTTPTLTSPYVVGQTTTSTAPAPAVPATVNLDPATQRVVEAATSLQSAQKITFNRFEREEAVRDARTELKQAIVDGTLELTAANLQPGQTNVATVATEQARQLGQQVPASVNAATLSAQAQASAVAQASLASEALLKKDNSGAAVEFAKVWNRQSQDTSLSASAQQSLAIINANVMTAASERILKTDGFENFTDFYTQSAEALENAQAHVMGDVRGEQALAIAAVPTANLFEKFLADPPPLDPNVMYTMSDTADYSYKLTQAISSTEKVIESAANGNAALLKATSDVLQHRAAWDAPVPAAGDLATARTAARQAESMQVAAIDLAKQKLDDLIANPGKDIIFLQDMIRTHGVWNPANIDTAVKEFLATEKGAKVGEAYDNYAAELDTKAGNLYRTIWDNQFVGSPATAAVTKAISSTMADPTVNAAFDNSLAVQADVVRFTTSYAGALTQAIDQGDPAAIKLADGLAGLNPDGSLAANDTLGGGPQATPNLGPAVSLFERNQMRWASILPPVLGMSAAHILTKGQAGGPTANALPNIFAAGSAGGVVLRTLRAPQFAIDAGVHFGNMANGDNSVAVRAASLARGTAQVLNSLDDVLSVSRNLGPAWQRISSGTQGWLPGPATSVGTAIPAGKLANLLTPTARGLATLGAGIQLVNDSVSVIKGTNNIQAGDIALDVTDLVGGVSWTVGAAMQNGLIGAGGTAVAGSAAAVSTGAVLTGVGAVILAVGLVSRIQYNRVKESNIHETAEDRQFIQTVTGLDADRARELSNRSSKGRSAEPVLHDYLTRTQCLTDAQAIDYLKQLSPKQIEDFVKVAHGVRLDPANGQNVDTASNDQDVLDGPKYVMAARAGAILTNDPSPRSAAGLDNYRIRNKLPDPADLCVAPTPPVVSAPPDRIDPAPVNTPVRPAPADPPRTYPDVLSWQLPPLYQVQKGDNLWDIAEGQQLPLDTLYSLNPQFDPNRANSNFFTPEAVDARRDPDLIQPGEWLIVGGSS